MTTTARHVLFLSIVILLISQAISCASDEPKAHTFQVPITATQRASTVELQTIEVKHDDTVTLIIDTAAFGTFHLHGYDLEKTVSPDSENQLSFEAYATGRFPMTFHPATKMNHQNHDHEEKACSPEFSSNGLQPSIDMHAAPVANTGEIEVSILVQGFSLGDEDGHWHLYINGELSGMYSRPTITTKSLDPGDYNLVAVLSDVNHCEYQVSSTAQVAIEKSAPHAAHGNGIEEEHAHDDKETEISLGYLEVYPR